jgi:hypothetical protein
MKKNLQLWCMANHKDITIEDFGEKTELDFHDFFKKNKKMCLLEWQTFIASDRLSKKKVKKAKGKCNCEEMCLIPNAFRVVVKTPVAEWRCPEHGNRFKDLPN